MSQTIYVVTCEEWSNISDTARRFSAVRAFSDADEAEAYKTSQNMVSRYSPERYYVEDVELN